MIPNGELERLIKAMYRLFSFAWSFCSLSYDFHETIASDLDFGKIVVIL